MATTGNVYVVETDGFFGAIHKALSDHEIIQKERKRNAELQLQYQRCHEEMQTYYAQASALSRENQSLKATVKDLQARQTQESTPSISVMPKKNNRG
jgi:hypothetical protein